MAKYYAFENEDTFIKLHLKSDAMHFQSLGRIIFKHVDGFPNPWICHLIGEDGKAVVNKKTGEKMVFRYGQIKARIKTILHKRRKKTEERVAMNEGFATVKSDLESFKDANDFREYVVNYRKKITHIFWPEETHAVAIDVKGEDVKFETSQNLSQEEKAYLISDFNDFRWWRKAYVKAEVKKEEESKGYIPERVKPYVDLFNNTGGNKPEDLLRRLETEKNLAFSNIIVFTMATMSQGQVHLIETLLEEGLLLPRGEKK